MRRHVSAIMLEPSDHFGQSFDAIMQELNKEDVAPAVNNLMPQVNDVNKRKERFFHKNFQDNDFEWLCETYKKHIFPAPIPDKLNFLATWKTLIGENLYNIHQEDFQSDFIQAINAFKDNELFAQFIDYFLKLELLDVLERYLAGNPDNFLGKVIVNIFAEEKVKNQNEGEKEYYPKIHWFEFVYFEEIKAVLTELVPEDMVEPGAPLASSQLEFWGAELIKLLADAANSHPNSFDKLNVFSQNFLVWHKNKSDELVKLFNEELIGFDDALLRPNMLLLAKAQSVIYSSYNPYYAEQSAPSKRASIDFRQGKSLEFIRHVNHHNVSKEIERHPYNALLLRNLASKMDLKSTQELDKILGLRRHHLERLSDDKPAQVDLRAALGEADEGSESDGDQFQLSPDPDRRTPSDSADHDHSSMAPPVGSGELLPNSAPALSAFKPYVVPKKRRASFSKHVALTAAAGSTRRGSIRSPAPSEKESSSSGSAAGHLPGQLPANGRVAADHYYGGGILDTKKLGQNPAAFLSRPAQGGNEKTGLLEGSDQKRPWWKCCG